MSSNGVYCKIIDQSQSFEETILKFLDQGNEPSLELDNKYYKARLQLIDESTITSQSDRQPCHAVLLYANGLTLTVGQLDQVISTVDWIADGPRILLCDKIDEECPSYRSFLDWSIKNEFDLILADEKDSKNLVVNSLSAYHWPCRIELRDESNEEKKLTDFENLLTKISSYKGESNRVMDDKIEEIADLLSKLIDEDQDE